MALFDSAALTEKLSKLNASAQSIETLSQWCLFHRKKSREVRRNAPRPRARCVARGASLASALTRRRRW